MGVSVTLLPATKCRSLHCSMPSRGRSQHQVGNPVLPTHVEDQIAEWVGNMGSHRLWRWAAKLIDKMQQIVKSIPLQYLGKTDGRHYAGTSFSLTL